MRELSHLALLGWIPFCLCIFAWLPARKAMLFCLMTAMLLLPRDAIPVSGFIDINKGSVTILGCMAGVLLFDAGRLFSFRPSWLDLPMVVVTFMPVLSALANGFSGYAAFSETLEVWMQFGGPYLLGRLYLSDEVGKRLMLIAMIIGGAIYTPLCLWEIRMSPQLHAQLYGFFPSSFAQTVRGGGFRPVVFLGHGLALSLFMAMAAVCLSYLYAAKGVRRVAMVPAGLATLGICLTLVLCKSSGATILMIVALLALYEAKRFGSRRLLWLMIIVSSLYVPLRASQTWDGQVMTEFAAMISEARRESLAYRLNNEKILLDSMGDRFWIGRGPSQDVNAIFDARGQRTWIVADSIWINLLTAGGALSSLAFWFCLVLACWNGLRSVHPRNWLTRACVGTASMTVLTVMFLVDCMANATIMVTSMAIVGGLIGSSPRETDTDLQLS